ncbi:glycosyltransferase family 2 protein [Bipolaris maydis ATCC 48331]|uniref:Glycosyltransferase family 2 protein n=2 Tax=Cochliobolus heterostrophus TaxID=5016 RepID=M2UT45_COCH5|nr:glycosyltransferase family 2 protein [Bipolaris maydis ATCC 48331]EMD91058.1 glycosyltransferase family 2 protein [Bipolaris maydis C5]KAJ5022777.1 glycosyltransferase [Bipolaris maydis]ENI05859.1 glycosyltransferase family 2 protein [Bipolaris maydis ATCC 48331]KAJ5064544.1 nucleotide-diphospho-sugar transferase [Bipolaris maydis]KAJ6193441.1 nucleotide-diphospho-sugar transferase [Bipolaris maydis]
MPDNKDCVIDVGDVSSPTNCITEKPAPKSNWSPSQVIGQSSSWISEWTPFGLVVSYYIFSVCMYMYCSDSLIAIFWFIYMCTNFYIAGTTVLEAFFSITPCREAREVVTQAQDRKWHFPTPDSKLPILDLLIVAYLPNEQDIIMDRAYYALKEIAYPSDRIRINVLYNTPKPIEPLETELAELPLRFPHARVIKVPGSTSKADNLNYFFTLDTGSDLIAIYDCDHYPHPNAPRWAAERFMAEKDVDIVQGRCIVFNSEDSFMTSMISVEFDKIYAVSHPGRSTMWGFGLFCGSNGYWRTSLLRDLKMDESMLTEDIDSALRAFSKGAKTVHDLNVTSYELAPTTFAAFWKQRLRWAQGWAQASMRHMKMVWNGVKDPLHEEHAKRSFTARFGMLSLLLIRESSYYLVTQYTCLVASFVIVKFPTNGEELWKLVYFQYPISQWLFIISVICLIATLWITNQVKSEFVSRKMIILFSVLYPFYLVLSATIGLYGHARQLVKYSSWNPTARK